MDRNFVQAEQRYLYGNTVDTISWNTYKAITKDTKEKEQKKEGE